MTEYIHSEAVIGRRNLVRGAGALAAATALPVSSVAAAPRAAAAGDEPRPNVVVIFADDISAEMLREYGGRLSLPNLERLSAEGTTFHQCHSQPNCAPSRMQLLTGRYNHRNWDRWGYLRPTERTFANLFRDAGYATAVSGKWQLDGDADTIRGFGFDEHALWQVSKTPSGWDNSLDQPMLVNGEWVKQSYAPRTSADFAHDFIERSAADERPFLLYYPTMLAHAPYHVPPGFSGPATDRRKYSYMIQFLDRLVGEIVTTLERAGALDDTILVFTADNGTPGGFTMTTDDGVITGGKSTTKVTGSHVPLIVHAPGSPAGGAINHDLVDFSDFLPTLCDLAGIGFDGAGLDGLSFAGRALGDTAADEVRRRFVYTHFVGIKDGPAKRYVHDANFKKYVGEAHVYNINHDPEESAPSSTDIIAQEASVRLQQVLDQIPTRTARELHGLTDALRVESPWSTKREIALRWNGGHPARVFRNGVELAHAADGMFVDVALEPGRTYMYRVVPVAGGAAENLSASTIA